MKRRVGAVELGYEVRGHGPTLVLLHAFPLDRRMWGGELVALSDEHRVVALDFRGFGESGGRSTSIVELADDVAHLLDALGIPMAALLGLSMGGYVALAFAARHRARLSALILADTRAGADSDEGKRARDAGVATVQEHGVAALLQPLVGRLLSGAAPAPLRAQVEAWARAGSQEAVVAALGALRDRPDRTGELGAIDCPTLVLAGTADVVTPPTEAEALALAIPGAQLCLLADAGHLSNLEAPHTFISAVREFLRE